MAIKQVWCEWVISCCHGVVIIHLKAKDCVETLHSYQISIRNSRSTNVLTYIVFLLINIIYGHYRNPFPPPLEVEMGENLEILTRDQ